MLNTVMEEEIVGTIAGFFPRSPQQKNRTGECDAEIITLPGGACLALTTDTIAEEIEAGLYTDPYLAGWMVVMANFSDIAAAGAHPAGMLVSEILPPGCPAGFIESLQKGIADASAACGSFILGGDTGTGEKLVLTGTAAGICSNGEYHSRTGCRPGDLLFSTNLLGTGNAYAYEKLIRNPGRDSGLRISYQPHARITEGLSLLGVASACMDTSDGVMATLDTLARLNHVGFELDAEWLSALEPAAEQAARKAGFSPWLLLAGFHGEFELLFTVPPSKEQELYVRAEASGWQPVKLGSVLVEEVVRMPYNGRYVRIDTARIRNCAYRLTGDVRPYYNEMLKIDNELCEGVRHARDTQ